MKRAELTKGQKVLIIFIKDLGFVDIWAEFLRYDYKNLGTLYHRTPIFSTYNKEISGLDCFWLRESDSSLSEQYKKYIVGLQLTAQELSYHTGYTIVDKMKDKEIKAMAQENVSKMQSLIAKLGYDPTDTSKLLSDLADNQTERNWFVFDEENALIFAGKWDEAVNDFNRQYNEKVTVEQAKEMSLKRARYVVGSFYRRMSGDKDFNGWKDSALDFEKYVLGVSERMQKWSKEHYDNYPVVQLKKDTNFFPGPYFNACIEKFPHYFTDHFCSKVKAGTTVRIVAYDPKEKYISLDFQENDATILRGKKNKTPWIHSEKDYEFRIKPEEVDLYVEINE